MTEEEFDKEFIESAENIADTLKNSAISTEKEIRKLPDMGAKTKDILSFISHLSLNGLSKSFQLNAINMRLFNENKEVIKHIEDTIDRLPEEFYLIKKQLRTDISKRNRQMELRIKEFRNGITLNSEEYDFVKYATRLTQEKAKDVEKE